MFGVNGVNDGVAGANLLKVVDREGLTPLEYATSDDMRRFLHDHCQGKPYRLYICLCELDFVCSICDRRSIV